VEIGASWRRRHTQHIRRVKILSAGSDLTGERARKREKGLYLLSCTDVAGEGFSIFPG